MKVAALHAPNGERTLVQILCATIGASVTLSHARPSIRIKHSDNAIANHPGTRFGAIVVGERFTPMGNV
ncbi:hypothetical protein G6L94_32375 [Agrobacterium rhizogenes]|nr:hypothetical protein [Rhizobium rhizogenes]NTI53014.1 hypothetical protein [Rhizobium rhizogenes]NTI98387.1 hypothetical protein [Rhizobium rhizogenes]NTJ60815.1 hypothetical protein [Rhizobium rhizogenes]